MGDYGQALYERVAETMLRNEGIAWPSWQELPMPERRGWREVEFDLQVDEEFDV